MRNWGKFYRYQGFGPRPISSSLSGVIAASVMLERHAPTQPARENRKPITGTSSSFRDEIPFTTDEMPPDRDTFPHDDDEVTPAQMSQRLPKGHTAAGPEHAPDKHWRGHKFHRNLGRKPRAKDHRA